MIDKGIVLSTKKDLAKIEVNCLSVCHDCSAHALCIGNSRSRGLLSVKNPLCAFPGDLVSIEVPEEKYSRSLILLFGGLLASALLGLVLGYLMSVFIVVSAEPAALVGTLTGLLTGILVLFKYFQNENKRNLYPFITEIIKKGARHG